MLHAWPDCRTLVPKIAAVEGHAVLLAIGIVALAPALGAPMLNLQQPLLHHRQRRSLQVRSSGLALTPAPAQADHLLPLGASPKLSSHLGCTATSNGLRGCSA